MPVLGWSNPGHTTIEVKYDGQWHYFDVFLKCYYCNLAKSSNLSGRDTVTGRIVVLFNPRRQRWHRHFEWDGPRLVGLTPCCRATIAVFNINAAHRIDLRELLIEAGLFPPD